MINWCIQANKGCEHANIFGYCEMTDCTEIDLESQDKQDKFALICGYPIDKVVEIVDDYKQGNLLSTKGTVKLRKGDYVLYKHSWLKEHLDMEYKVLGGKAISIEWLEEKAEHYQKAYEAEVEQNGYDASRYYLDMYNAIYTLIDEWETENG